MRSLNLKVHFDTLEMCLEKQQIYKYMVLNIFVAEESKKGIGVFKMLINI